MPPFLHSLLGVFVTVLGAGVGIGLWLLTCWTDGLTLLFGGCSFPLSFFGPVIAFFDGPLWSAWFQCSLGSLRPCPLSAVWGEYDDQTGAGS